MCAAFNTANDLLIPVNQQWHPGKKVRAEISAADREHRRHFRSSRKLENTAMRQLSSLYHYSEAQMKKLHYRPLRSFEILELADLPKSSLILL